MEKWNHMLKLATYYFLPSKQRKSILDGDWYFIYASAPRFVLQRRRYIKNSIHTLIYPLSNTQCCCHIIFHFTSPFLVLASLLCHKRFFHNFHKLVVQSFGGINSKDKIDVIPLRDELVKFKVGYLRDQCVNICFIGQGVMAAVEKRRGRGHFGYVVNWWRVL